MSLLTVTILDEVSINIHGLRSNDLNFFVEKYSLFAANYFFSPKFKMGRWDGKIKHFDKSGNTFLYLLPEILSEAVKMGYKVKVIDKRDSPFYEPQPIDENLFIEHLHPDTGNPITLRDYQVNAVNALITEGNGICLSCTGSGKAQSINSKVLTPSGWRTMGSLVPGDLVITPMGKVSKIIDTFPQGKKQLYKISFDDNSSTLCCSEHLWEVTIKHLQTDKEDVVSLLTTELIETFLRSNNSQDTKLTINMVNPIDMKLYTPKIPSYIVGSIAVFYDVENNNFNSIPYNVGNKLIDLYNQRDISLSLQENGSYTIDNILDDFINVLSNVELLSLSDKLDLIRGVLEIKGLKQVDGTILVILQRSNIADYIAACIRSIGGWVNIVETNTTKKLYIRLKDVNNFLTVDNYTVLDSTKVYRTITKVEFDSIDEAQCILIDDPDHLYITDDYIVTHNTLICAAICTAYTPFNIKTITIVPDQNLTMQTIRTYDSVGLDVGEYSGRRKTLEHQHIVSTWQSLQYNTMLMNSFDLVIVDECHQLKGPIIRSIVCDHASRTPYRFGVTGTLPKEPIDELAVKLAVGQVRCEIKASDLIARNILAKLDIECIQLLEDLTNEYEDYKNELKPTETPVSYIIFKNKYFPEYAAEKSWLEHNERRIQWIADKIMDERDHRGNVLCFINSIPMSRKIANYIPDVIVVNGQDVANPKARQVLYDRFEKENGIIMLATPKIAGTGLSINRIFTLISVDLGKSFVKTIQAIGRGLRTSQDKKDIRFVDISSDFKFGKQHLKTRTDYYTEASYPYIIKKVKYIS